MNTLFYYIFLPVMVIITGFIIYLRIPEKNLKRKTALKNIAEIINPELLENDPSTMVASDRTTWNNQRIGLFYDKYILPIETVLISSGYQKKIVSILLLLDKFGNCPSVVQDNHFEETDQNIYDILAKVTLADHSLHVAEKLIDNIKLSAKDYEFMAGAALIAALAHDLGKASAIRQKKIYSKGDHPYIAYEFLKQQILTDKFPGKDKILKAVRDHHFDHTDKNSLSYKLCEADHEAREQEVESFSLLNPEIKNAKKSEKKISNANNQKKISRQPKSKNKTARPKAVDLTWLDINKFLSLIEKEINVVDKGYFKSFSMNNGLVYVMLQLISDTVLSMAKENGENKLLVRGTGRIQRRNIEYSVTCILRQKDLIPDFIAEGYPGAPFSLKNIHKKQMLTGYYTPIKAEAFKTTLSKLEKRKKESKLLLKIIEVQALIRQK